MALWLLAYAIKSYHIISNSVYSLSKIQLSERASERQIDPTSANVSIRPRVVGRCVRDEHGRGRVTFSVDWDFHVSATKPGMDHLEGCLC